MSSDLSLGPAHPAAASSGIACTRWIKGPAWDLVWVLNMAGAGPTPRPRIDPCSRRRRQAARGLLQ